MTDFLYRFGIGWGLVTGIYLAQQLFHLALHVLGVGHGF
jgi:hypothetical protein